jgi:hypothetical protein
VQTRLTDILPQHALDLLLRISALHDQAPVPVHTSLRAQLRVQELDHVLRMPVHPPADVRKVREHGLLRALARDLRGHDGVPPLLAGELGVVLVQ